MANPILPSLKNPHLPHHTIHPIPPSMPRTLRKHINDHHPKHNTPNPHIRRQIQPLPHHQPHSRNQHNPKPRPNRIHQSHRQRLHNLRQQKKRNPIPKQTHHRKPRLRKPLTQLQTRRCHRLNHNRHQQKQPNRLHQKPTHLHQFT